MSQPERDHGGTAADPGVFAAGPARWSNSICLPAEYSYRGEGSGTQTSFGVAGGLPGDTGACHIVFPDGRRYDPPQYGVEKHGPLRLVISSSGGGGFGDPRTRSAQRVREDVRDGLVSARAAKDAYGVELGEAPDFRVDEKATAILRAAAAQSL